MTAALALVPFEGDTVEVVDDAGRGHVVIRRICDNLGVDADTQRRKLKSCAWATTVMMTVVAEDGKKRELVCLPVEQVQIWLATIDVSRVRAELREKLTAYQKRCAEVLHAYFTGKLTPATAPSLSSDQLDQLADRLGARLGEVLARQLDAQPARTGLNVARLVKVKLVEIRDLMTDGMTRKQRSSVLGDLTVELRRRLGFFGTGCSFDNLSAEQWCKARVELEAMLRTAEKTAKRRQTELFGDPAPLSLGSPDPKGTN